MHDRSPANDKIIEDAAELVQMRHPDDPPTVSKPPNWRDIGIDLVFRRHIVRLRPDTDGALIQVFGRQDVFLLDDRVAGYDSADDLADRIGANYRRAP